MKTLFFMVFLFILSLFLTPLQTKAQVKTPTKVTVTHCNQKYCEQQQVFIERKCKAKGWEEGKLAPQFRTGFTCFCPCPSGTNGESGC